MEINKSSVFVFLFISALAIEIPTHIVPTTTPAIQAKAVEEIIARTIGDDASKYFKVNVDRALEFRSFKLNITNENKLLISAWDGVSAAKGFHYYLKYYLDHDVTWTNRRVQLQLPVKLPDVNITSKSGSAFIYYQNVCTWSYSFAWWNWSQWRQHIDWIAMMGISITIAPIQENIWYNVYTKFGLTESEIQEHFAGPAFQAWQRMGNIRGWGGPMNPTYRDMQYLLQKRIISAQRELGITVALPAFAGHVPTAMSRIYPHTKFTSVERWNKFPDKYCCPLFLDPNDELFRNISTEFLSSVNSAYGTNHIYFCDPFNEIQPRLAEVDYLNMTAYHIFDAMHSVDPSAIWLLQGWMFVKNVFWTDDLIKAFLTAPPLGKLLVLDLQSEQFSQYERTNSFHGQPFIWCMLHNFGGTLGMHGSAEIVNTQIGHARSMPNSTMIGVGITPEGIHQNYVMYSLAMERAWSFYDLHLPEWFNKFAYIRYGIVDKRLSDTWQLLQTSVYSYKGLRKIRGKYTITRRPAFNLNPWTWYNESSIQLALELLLAANSSTPLEYYDVYSHDLVDITRQFLQLMFDRLYVNLISAYQKQQLERYTYITTKLVKLFDQLELILSTHSDFLLGPWLESAKHYADTKLEKILNEFNARNQITIWGPNGQILDYATKQWSGIVRDYYQPRWLLFFNMTINCLREKKRFNSTLFKHIVSQDFENPFSVQMTTYPIIGTGHTFETSQQIYMDWMEMLENRAFLHNVRLRVKLI